MIESPKTPEVLSDEALLRRFNEGDVEAFEALMGRYERPLYNFVLRSVRRRDRAEELLQDVFMKVVQRSGDFKGHSKVSTWLYTIARNLCIDHSRKMVFRRHDSLDARSRSGTSRSSVDRSSNTGSSNTGSSNTGSSLAERIAAQGPTADRSAIAHELRERIAEAVEALPVEQREVFLLRQLQGMPFKEIAEVVAIPENTVKSRMRYALERLQRALSEYQDYVRELR